MFLFGYILCFHINFYLPCRPISPCVSTSINCTINVFLINNRTVMNCTHHTGLKHANDLCALLNEVRTLFGILNLLRYVILVTSIRFRAKWDNLWGTGMLKISIWSIYNICIGVFRFKWIVNRYYKFSLIIMKNCK